MNLKLFITIMIVSIIVESILIFFDVPFLLTISISFLVAFLGILVTWLIPYKRMINILDQECDPERFVLECKKWLRKSKMARFRNMMYLNIAAGYHESGQFQKAHDTLDHIDLSANKQKVIDTYYYLNKMACLIDLNHYSEAEFIFETKLKSQINDQKMSRIGAVLNINLSLIHFLPNQTKKTADIFLAEMERYEQFILKNKWKRIKLHYLYMRAEIEKDFGSPNEARKIYETIINEGNKLHLVILSKQRVQELT